MRYSIIIFLLLSACSQLKETEFSLKGVTQGIEDGTIIKLIQPENSKTLDSTIVTNNQFEFKTTLPENPMLAVLHIEDFSQYRSIWLENVSMTFNSTNTDFRHAEVEGSELEDLSEKFILGIDSIPNYDKQRRMKYEVGFIESNPNSIMSAYMLEAYCTTWGKELTQKLYNQFSPQLKQTSHGKTISTYLKLTKDLQIGDKYVDFEISTVEGETVRLSDYVGKILLLEFWASSCHPCREENPYLVKTYKKYNKLGFEIFAVSQDTKRDNWVRAIKNDRLPWLQTSDLEGSKNIPSLIYGVKGIPDNFLIDQQGKIIDRNIRSEALNIRLEQLLNLE